MAVTGRTIPLLKRPLPPVLGRLLLPLRAVPMVGWIFGIMAAVATEALAGDVLAVALGLDGVPPLFGVTDVLRRPLLTPSTVIYLALIYLLPATLVAGGTARLANRLSAALIKTSHWLSVLVHLGLFYAALHVWAGLSDYRDLVLRLALIAILVTLSLNVINGYMGEFSCSHPGFMSIGAYASAVTTVILFVDGNRFTQRALLPAALGPWLLPLPIIVGGLAGSLAALVVAIPSFRTRGDYLAVVSLAFTFIVKSAIENLEVVGGPRGFMDQPSWAGLPMVFLWTMLGVGIMNTFLRSTMGKALNAVRDDEVAASAMTVDTRRTKMVAFLFSAFWAAAAGGLLAHVLAYINPATFGLQKLAEVLAMVYFGGLNSVPGSVVGAVGFTLFSEGLRPLGIFKWIIVPLLLILVMIFRPYGLIAFRDLNVRRLLEPRRVEEVETRHAAARG